MDAKTYLGWGLVAWLMLAANGRAEEPAPATPAPSAAQTTPISACQEKLRVLAGLVDRLEAEARNAEQPDRLNCILEVQARIKGLKEWTEVAQARLKGAAAQDDQAALEDATVQIRITCERAEKLAVDAADCSAVATTKKTERRPPPKAPPKEPVSRPPAPVTSLPRLQQTLPRNRSTCLKQEQLACLLVKAMGLSGEANQSKPDCLALLSHREIKPPGGWQPGNCAERKDFCVLLSQILKITISNPQDDAACFQALREQGLPVDLYLLGTPEQQQSPLLLEPEVREFLSQGLAAPLPASHPVPPE